MSLYRSAVGIRAGIAAALNALWSRKTDSLPPRENGATPTRPARNPEERRNGHTPRCLDDFAALHAERASTPWSVDELKSHLWGVLLDREAAGNVLALCARAQDKLTEGDLRSLEPYVRLLEGTSATRGADTERAEALQSVRTILEGVAKRP